MPCSASSRSLAALHVSGSPTRTGTMWVALGITGSRAALSTALTRAARSWWRSRSKLELLRWRIAAAAAAQIGGGRRGGEVDAGPVPPPGAARPGPPRVVPAEAAEGFGQRAFQHVDALHRALQLGLAAAARTIHADRVHLVGVRQSAVALGEIAD